MKNNTISKVKDVLMSTTESRNNDYLLYVEVAKEYGYNILNMSVKDVLKLVCCKELPLFETVSRNRREIQREDFTLQGSKQQKNTYLKELYKELSEE